jgi:hypothetical protein
MRGPAVTFVATAINPHVGAWQLADAELSDGNRNWCKQVYFLGVHGFLLLGYSGLARMPDWTDMATWLAGQVIQPMTTDDILTLLVSRLDQKWARLPANYRSQSLTVGGAAFVDGVLPECVAIGNRLTDGTTQDHFELVRDTVKNTGWLSADGSGAASVPVSAQKEVCDRIAFAHEAGSPNDYAAALAGLVTHARRARGVSPWCQVVFAPATYDPSTRLMLHGEVHVPAGEHLPKWIKPIRVNCFGHDQSHLIESMQTSGGLPTSDRVYTWDIAVEVVD